MKPVVVYRDAQAAAASVLRTLLAAREEPFVAGVQVGTRIPTGRTIDSPAYPYVMCVQDGPGSSRNLALSVVDVRVTVWAKTEDDAYDLAQLCHGLLLAHSGDAIRSTLPALSPYPAEDPETGEPVASFSVACNLRPRAV